MCLKRPTHFLGSFVHSKFWTFSWVERHLPIRREGSYFANGRTFEYKKETLKKLRIKTWQQIVFIKQKVPPSKFSLSW
jgi:hypothetical protein